MFKMIKQLSAFIFTEPYLSGTPNFSGAVNRQRSFRVEGLVAWLFLFQFLNSKICFLS